MNVKRKLKIKKKLKNESSLRVRDRHLLNTGRGEVDVDGENSDVLGHFLRRSSESLRRIKIPRIAEFRERKKERERDVWRFVGAVQMGGFPVYL